MSTLQHVLREHGYILPSFHTYGGKQGYHDIGPNGKQVLNKLIDLWRKKFLFSFDIDEIECPIITPNAVLTASGHVSKFTDPIIYDNEGKMHRVDHLIEDLNREHGFNYKPESMSNFEMAKVVEEHKLIVSDNYQVEDKNLMFEVDDSNEPSFLRPELAQGIVLNLERYHSQFRKKLPFGLAQIGRSYRKEISPKPFTRMREFMQAEIEYAYDPEDNFENLRRKLTTCDRNLVLVDRNGIEMNITAAVALDRGIVTNPIVLQFIVATDEFVTDIGIKNYRFRQHTENEMAHYASDCWDLECEIDGNWIECAGLADRGCYDLKCHNLVFSRELVVPKKIVEKTVIPNKKLIGTIYKQNANKVFEYFASVDKDQFIEMLLSGTPIVIDNLPPLVETMFTIKIKETTTNVENFYPHIVEPSFGIDRLLYALFYSSLWTRESDENRHVLSLPQTVVPYDIAVLQLSNNDKILEKVDEITTRLRKYYRVYTDSSGVAIGRRYARLDQIGVKYAITVDFGTVEQGELYNTVTIRERDSTDQTRHTLPDGDSIVEFFTSVTKK